MPVTDSQKIDYIWKKVGYGVAKTDTNSNKYAVNESIASPLLGRGDTIWQQSGDIPGTKPSSSTSVVEVYAGSTLVECTADTTATANRTWLTNETDWIGIEFGSTYLVEVFIHTSGDPAGADDISNKVFITGSGSNDEWYFDYQAGVVNFIGTNLPSGVSFTGKSVYVKGARYIGPKGLPTVPTTTSELTNDSGFITLADVPGGSVDFTLAVAGDDSTLIDINSGESISFLGGTGISTTTNAEGAVTISSTLSVPTAVSELTNDSGFITLADVPVTFGFSVGADDSTLRAIGSGESFKIIGGTNISTTSDAEGNITVTNDFAQDFAYSSLTGTPGIPSTLGELTNDVGFITLAEVPERFGFSIGADDSTLRVIGAGEGVLIQGGTNISTTSDAEGNITITNDFTQDFAYSSLTGAPTIPSNTSDLTNDSGFITADQVPTTYTFDVGADDSTMRTINSGEGVRFIGGTNISTTSDAEGNITITNDFTQDFAFSSITGTPTTIAGYGITDAFDGDYNSLTNTPTIPSAVSELTNDAGYLTSVETFSLSVAADDSTLQTINDGESIKFVGATGVTTSSDAEGTISITGPELSSYLTSETTTTLSLSANILTYTD